MELTEVLTKGTRKALGWGWGRQDRVPWMKDNDNAFAGGSCIRLSKCECLNAREYILELQPPFDLPVGDYLGLSKLSSVDLHP